MELVHWPECPGGKDCRRVRHIVGLPNSIEEIFERKRAERRGLVVLGRGSLRALANGGSMRAADQDEDVRDRGVTNIPDEDDRDPEPDDDEFDVDEDDEDLEDVDEDDDASLAHSSCGAPSINLTSQGGTLWIRIT